MIVLNVGGTLFYNQYLYITRNLKQLQKIITFWGDAQLLEKASISLLEIRNMYFNQLGTYLTIGIEL